MFRRRSPEPAEPRGGESGVPTPELLMSIFDEFGLNHDIDADGDLTLRWEKGNIYFFFYGERKEVVQARLYLHRRFPVDARPGLALAMDEWNRTKLFPKAYTVVPDDGMVGICAERCHDFEMGATREQVRFTVAQWIDTLLRFADWVEDQM